MWYERLRTYWYRVLFVAAVGLAVATLVLGWAVLPIFIVAVILVAVTGVVDSIRDTHRNDAESSAGSLSSDSPRESTDP
jgi:fatty acid desaturase